MAKMFSAFKHRNYRLFWSGNLISLTGSWMQTMALSWLIYRITHSAFLLGFIGFANAIPLLFLSPFAGVIVDRISKKKILYFTQISLMLSAIALALLTYYGNIQPWHIFVFTIINGTIGAIDAPARLSFVVELVGKEDLMNAIAMNSMAFNTARILGPAVAGFLVAIIHESGCFFINGISFVTVLISLTLMKFPPFIEKVTKDSYMTGMMDGIHYIKQKRVLLGLLVLVTVPSLLSLSYATLMPIFAKEIFKREADGMGILLSCVGIGAVMGALVVARVSHSKVRGKILISGAIGSSLSIIAFGLSRNFYLSCFILILVGISNVMYLATTNTLIQSNSQDEYRGRVISFYTLIFQGMMPIGSLLLGTMASWFTASTTIVITASITLFYVLLMNWFFPQLRALH